MSDPASGARTDQGNRGGTHVSALPDFDALLARAAALPPLRVAVAAAGDTATLQGLAAAIHEGLIEPVLIGSEARVRSLWRESNDGPVPEVCDPGKGTSPAAAAVQLVADGRAEALMKGALHTDVLMKAVLAQLRTARRVSHVFLVELPSYHKPLAISDAAVNIAPDLAVKAEILRNAIDLAHALGVEEPKAAALSAVETIEPAIASSVDAACLSKMAERGQIEGALVDGPLAFDNAISREAAQTKGIESAVAGDVDILLVPNLDAGNILAKDLSYLARATLAGIVVGARVPVILTSRSDPPRARLVSAALAALAARAAAENGHD